VVNIGGDRVLAGIMLADDHGVVTSGNISHAKSIVGPSEGTVDWRRYLG
jgi:hypothetical protein